MKDHAERFVVLTGGPGSGKTAVIEALRHRGYTVSPEGGRSIIQDQSTIGGRALPWLDRPLFAELMLSWDMRSYSTALHSAGPVFFDRGVVDTLGYYRLIGLPPPVHVARAVRAFSYNRRVFIAPPWEEIYEQDCERKQDFPEAVRTYEAIAAGYTECGYELVEIPRIPVEDRVLFVLEAAGCAARRSLPETADS